MMGWVGIALVVACILAMGLAHARGSEPIQILRSDAVQSAFMMIWLVAFIFGAALIVQHFVTAPS
jgi:hypothetical protein